MEIPPSFQGSGVMLSPADLAAEKGAWERLQDGNSHRLYCLVSADNLGSGKDLLTYFKNVIRGAVQDLAAQPRTCCFSP